jgi:hypothetical protein
MKKNADKLLTFVIAAVLPWNAGAQPLPNGGNAASPHSGPVRTGKERLGDKWTDEQRVDNCKVPIEKRGKKPRPGTCPPDLTQ